MQSGMYEGPGKQAVAWSQALASDMVFNQPVVYELKNLQVPTTLFIGQKDRTAIGRDLAPPAVKATLGNYPVLGKAAAAAIPGATLIEFAELGHSPQVQDPKQFNSALLKALKSR
jgi:pimeloyl-ACP methyl ester carboxylesterase